MKAFELNNLKKIYPEFQLGPVNLDLDPGTVLGYIGPNGSGKSTTLHCMVGLVKASAGEVKIFGRANHPNKPAWKHDIGYVGDVHVFYENWSAEKNLKFLRQFYPAWSDQLVTDLVKRFELPLNKKARDLSGGNRVKLSLVSALAHKPKLLLLDEPTAGLDPVVREQVLETLFGILEDGEHSIFYSTHILTDISRLADELAFLHNGQIIQRSTTADLIEQWRMISFNLEHTNGVIKGTINHQSDGKTHKVISNNPAQTLEHLSTLGARNIFENRMSIDEIAVAILKGVKNDSAA